MTIEINATSAIAMDTTRREAARVAEEATTAGLTRLNPEAQAHHTGKEIAEIEKLGEVHTTGSPPTREMVVTDLDLEATRIGEICLTLLNFIQIYTMFYYIICFIILLFEKLIKKIMYLLNETLQIYTKFYK